MYYSNTLAWHLKRGIVNFSEDITQDTERPITRPAAKFFAQVLYGMAASHSVLLSKIGSSLHEKASPRKVVERLSRNMKNYSHYLKPIFKRYLEVVVRPLTDDSTIYCLDPGDICKKRMGKQEGLRYIADGSNTHEAAPGWPLIEMVALTHGTKLPIPVYSKLYVSGESERDGQTGELTAAIDSKISSLGNGGVLTMDRGMDVNALYKHLLSNGQRFIVRTKATRALITSEGDRMDTEQLSQSCSGKAKMTFADTSGKKHMLRISTRQVTLPDVPDSPLSLVVVHGFKENDGEPPMTLLTDMPASSDEDALRVVKSYMCRWRIEECYKFKKQKLDLENVRVMSLDSLSATFTLASILTGYLSIFAHRESRLCLEARAQAKEIKERRKTGGFSICPIIDGIARILATSITGIKSFFSAPTKDALSHQMSLIKPTRFNYSQSC